MLEKMVGGPNMASIIQVRVDDELKARSDALFKDKAAYQVEVQ